MFGDYLKVRIKKLDIENNVFELSAKDFEENPFKNIRKYITLNGEYTGTVIAFPKQKSGIIVQLDNSNVTCMCRVPARFNNYPHFMDKVLIKVTEIKENNSKITRSYNIAQIRPSVTRYTTNAARNAANT